jgi:hypothetical protein
VSVSASAAAQDDRAAAASPAIVTTASRKHRTKDGPTLPMELPLSRKPVERNDNAYKGLKAAMTQRLRGAALPTPAVERGDMTLDAALATFRRKSEANRAKS